MPKTLLLADDSVTIQKVVGITFANEDVEIVTVDNGSDALQRAKEIRPDIVLADVGMQGVDGYQLCAALKSDPDLASVPVMLLTGTFESFDEGRMNEVKADAHIAKPFEAQMLVDQVHALLTRGVATEPARTAPAAIPAPLSNDPASPAEPDFSFDDLDFASPTTPARAAAPRVEATSPPLTLEPLEAEDDAFDGVSESLATTEREVDDAADALYEEADFVTPIPARGTSATAAELPAPDPTEVDSGFTLPAEPVEESVFGEPVREASPPARPTRLPVTDPPPPPGRPVTRVGPADPVAAAELLERMANETTTPRIESDELFVDAEAAVEPEEDDASEALEQPRFLRDTTLEDAEPLLEADLEDLDEAEPYHPPELSPVAPSPDATQTFEASPPEPEPEPLADPEPVAMPVTAAPEAPVAPAAASFALDERSVREAVEKVAWEAFGPLSEQIVGEIVRKLESIAWEVVPKLAERMVREEIERLKADAG